MSLLHEAMLWPRWRREKTRTMKWAQGPELRCLQAAAEGREGL